MRKLRELLANEPSVAEAAVFGEPDAYYGEQVAAAVRLASAASAVDLATHCGERLAGFKVPAVFYHVNALPFTASGKVRKTELRRWARDGDLERLP